jgi:hypothetical protein
LTRFPLHIALLLLMTLQARGQFIYSDFSQQCTYTLVGTATQQGRTILVSPGTGQLFAVGAIWHTYPVRMDTSWTCRMVFSITHTGGNLDYYGRDGGDGFALVIQNDSPAPLGDYGGGIGYAGIPNSLAIEFDTYGNEPQSGINDPSSNHVSIQTRGQLPNSARHAFRIGNYPSAAPEFSNVGEIVATIRYSAERSTLEVAFGCGEPRATARIRLDSLLQLTSGRAFIGVTAASESAWQHHWLHSWCFAYGSGPDCGCADTVRTTDTLTLRDTVTLVDTVRRTDTLTLHTTDTLVVRLTDTLTVVRIDTLTMTVRHVDTVTVAALVRDTLVVVDTVTVYRALPCGTTPIECDSLGRQMELLNYWRGIVAVSPNPARDGVTVTYELAGSDWHTLALYSVTGERVMVIAEGSPGAGRYVVRVDMRDVASGLYVLELRQGEQRWERIINVLR